MSLRSKLFILIFGSILIPLVVFILSVRLNVNFQLLRNLRSIFSPREEWQVTLENRVFPFNDIEGGLIGIPTDARVQVYSGDGRLLYEKPAEHRGTAEKAFILAVSIPVVFSSGDAGCVIVASPYLRVHPDDSDLMFFVPLAGLLVMAAVVILITQSINHSIAVLERATRKIANGDLDFELPTKGRDKFAALTRAFDCMREHLKEEYAMRSRFMMGVSHDLKTPLSSIGGYVSAIRDGHADTPEKLDKYTSIIQGKTRLLESRISLLIGYLKQNTHDWELNLQEISLQPFLREFAGLFEAEAAARRYRFRSRIEVGDDLLVSMDPDMVLRALENLAQNSLQHSPEGSGMSFSADRDGQSVVVEMTNEGSGIPACDLPHIFEPFMRGAKNRQGDGFGLGLATVKSVIASHGWSVSVDSRPGELTTFTIRIPLA